MATYLGVADVVLHTAEFEGTPNSLLEAQYLQKPVVTTPAGGAAEAVKNGVTGRVVDADDVTVFLEDFGRNQFNNRCPVCEVEDWRVY